MEQLTLLKGFEHDTLKGLTSAPKYLLPKYFYDANGSRIFQDIMQMDEYYLTDCEFEIFETQKLSIAKYFMSDNSPFQLIEFGSGDGLKSKVLLRQLLKRIIPFKYVPIDISRHAVEELEQSLKKEMPVLHVEAKVGDYFQIMGKIAEQSIMRKVILFLGANIGNFSEHETDLFFERLRNLTRMGDRLMIGFDLKKSPEIILKAYSDPHGHTKTFNLNHLIRLNKELKADFVLDNFEQHTEYNPVTGAVKSYLVSKKDQQVYIRDLDLKVHLAKWEPIYMELSQKFDYDDIENLANSHGFRIEYNFTDQKEYFVDSLWIRE